jgi:hypothetical protein
VQAFNALITRCPNQVTFCIPSIVQICLKHIAYDPNYTYEDDTSDVLGDGKSAATRNAPAPAAEAKKDAGEGGDEYVLPLSSPRALLRAFCRVR